jgi:Flp pilus assembly protein TadD
MVDFLDPTVRYPGAVLLACILAAAGAPALAQNSYSQPVVQAAPPAALGDLNAALKDLSRNPGDVAALLRAGWASLGLDDTQAALGFFRRAAAIQPQNGEIKAGLASASLRQGDPVSAVRLFAEAEAARAPMARYAADRGLALDLVGNNAAAQPFYRQALAQKNDPETIRRLALSQAIAGDQRGSDATLLPLLQHQDLAAYRTRAFALAILGKGEEAVSIAQTMLPATISGRLAPYLRYMPRLTRAQQAAAANLGQFPPASEIGRDDPQIAAFSGSASAPPQVASAAPDARLVPTGAPLGRSSRSAASERKLDARVPKASPKAKGGEIGVTDAPPQQVPTRALPPVQTAPPQRSAPPQLSQPVQRVAAAVQPPAAQVAESKPVLVASLDPQASAAPPAPAAEQTPTPAPSAAAVPKEKEVVSLADVFAEFAKPDAAVVRPAAGAVDISKIKPVRAAPKAEEPKAKEPKAKAKPKPPANPQRIWVQVATGRDVKALGFDWRRLQREGGALLARRSPYTARWGQTRRLLTGPFDTEAEADKAVSALKKKGIDAFEFTSDEGQEVASLK